MFYAKIKRVLMSAQKIVIRTIPSKDKGACMLNVSIPGYKDLKIENAVFDFNGTIATGGKLSNAFKTRMPEIKEKLNVYILTSDTFGTVAAQCDGLGINIIVLDGDNACALKGDFVRQLGASHTVCIGNGNNDIDMFRECALAILIMGEEGCSAKALPFADIVVKNIEDALSLLTDPTRIIATLRG